MKEHYLFVVLVIFCLNPLALASGSVAPYEDFNVTYEGTGWIRDFKTTSDGGYIFASNKLEGQAIIIVKTDGKGKEIWNLTFTEAGYNEPVSVVETGNDGYIFSGLHRKELEPGEDVLLPRELRIIRIDTNGNKLWNISLRGERTFPFDMISDGGIVIAGESENISDFLLSRISADGKEIWKKTIHAGELVMVYAISMTSDGYIIAGKNKSRGGWGNFDLWIMKTDPDGNVQWKKTFVEYRYESIQSIQESPDGNYILAGSGCKSWIGKFDRSGNELWRKTFSRSGHSFFQMTPDGGYLASGTDTIEKMDAEGNTQWIANFEKNGIVSLKQPLDGGLVAAGSSDNDIWLVKLKRGAFPFVSFIPEFPGRGQPVTFDASLSYDPDRNISGYRWDFGDGNTTLTKDEKILHSYASEGTYNISITLMDKHNIGMVSRTQAIEVQRSAHPEERWSRTHGGKFRDVERSVSTTTDGGYIMAGDTTFLYGIGAYLVKVDNKGDEEWNMTYPVIDGQSGARSVMQTSDGGYVFAGSINIHSKASQMIWLVKTDISGNMRWNRTFGRPGSIDDFSYNDGFSAIEDANGSFVVAGIIDLARGNIDSKFGLLLAKTDKDGNKLWERTWDPGGSSEAYSVIESIDGGYTVVGTAYFTDLMTTEAWLLHVDQNGEEKWLKKFTGNGTSPIAYSVYRTADGGYIIAGNMWKYESGNLIHPYIMKTDREGNMLWQKTYEDDYGYARHVRESKDGGYLILAGSDGSGIWLIKIDVNGSVQWYDKFEGNDPSSVIETSDGGYAIGGTKDNSCGNQDYDFWLAKLGGEGIFDPGTAAVNEEAGKYMDVQPVETKAAGFEWILMIFAMMAVVVVKKII
ncbi:MAG TPA: PKD domain-containing protein [Candidatus Methylomirabilis sp.]|nr:PKD domain-containing protein [Candidatus Methylomirabilis sp.]